MIVINKFGIFTRDQSDKIKGLIFEDALRNVVH